MTIKRTLALTGVISLSVLTAHSARAATLTATSFIPLIDIDRDVNRTPRPGSVVRASASGQGSSGQGFASFNGEVGAFAKSEDTIPQFFAFGSGGFDSGYVVEGNSNGTLLPLNFNFNLSGSLSADSELGNNISQGIASANVGGLLIGENSASPINGGAQLRSRAGVPLSFTQTGVFGSGSDNGFNRSFSIPLEVVDRGSVNYFINTSALVLPEASANSDYSSTLSLTSITVPEEFDAVDVDGLRVVFDSGFELPVQVENSGNGNGSGNSLQTVPEASTTFGIFLALLVGSPWLLKSKRNKTFSI